MVPLYLDVHVPRAIAEQLRRRGVDVLTVAEDARAECEDHEILSRAAELRRVVFTQDIRFRALAEDWQRRGIEFAGLLFGHQLAATIGQYVRDLELIAKASNPEEWRRIVQYLPLAGSVGRAR